MLANIPIKFIAGGLLLASLAFFIWLHLEDDKKLKNEIVYLNESISRLEVDKVKLVISNNSLKDKIESLEVNTKTIIAENNNLRLQELKSTKIINMFEKERKTKERKDRVSAALASKKASFLLRIANKQAACEWTHFDDFNGICKAGKWIVK